MGLLKRSVSMKTSNPKSDPRIRTEVLLAIPPKIKKTMMRPMVACQIFLQR
jgi:hypothetical protein